jgi:hypothetical protein
MYAHDEPVKDYSGYLKDVHARNVSEFFEELVRASQVDERENIETVSELRRLEARVAQGGSTRKWWRIARIALLILAGIFVVLGFNGDWAMLWFLPAVGIGAFIIGKVNPEVENLNSAIKKLEVARDKKASEAWKQMEPLNQLHTWDAPRDLLQRAFPGLQLDPFLEADRLADLQQTYGLSDDFMKGRSVLFPQSGTLNQNPFVITKFVQHWIGTKSYQGTLTIRWTERTISATGKFVKVERTETLTAEVQKPFPEFQDRAQIIYGHESAPQLSFSRIPSNLSGLDEGIISNWRKSSAVRKIEKKANKQLKSGDGQLTVMSNREFEALFNALDRDREIEFRLLFTPLAQQEMVTLLNDKVVGYGDNFAFAKQSRVHIVEPGHLGHIHIDANPELFRKLELKEAREFFNSFHNEYFKAIFFGFAPLLAVPLLREKRSLPLLVPSDRKGSVSRWEYQAMVNFLGEKNFKHPKSATRNLLTTEKEEVTGSTAKIRVSALGYEAVPRVDHVPTLGGDGKIHQVPVHWTEYIAVKKETSAVVGVIPEATSSEENTDRESQPYLTQLAESSGLTPKKVVSRGRLFAAV